MPTTTDGPKLRGSNARRGKNVPFHAEFGRVVSTVKSDRLKTALCIAWLILRPALWSALAAALIATSRTCSASRNHAVDPPALPHSRAAAQVVTSTILSP